MVYSVCDRSFYWCSMTGVLVHVFVKKVYLLGNTLCMFYWIHKQLVLTGTEFLNINRKICRCVAVLCFVNSRKIIIKMNGSQVLCIVCIVIFYNFLNWCNLILTAPDINSYICSYILVEYRRM